jgi:CBS domain-containing protein
MMQIQDRISAVLATKDSSLWTVAPHATVYDALELIARKDIGSVLVVEGGRLLGLFSEREYARNVALQGRNSRDTSVVDVMLTPALTISPDTCIDEAMRLMTDYHIRHLPVVKDNAVVGIISIGDLIKWIINAQQHTIEQLECYITGNFHTMFAHA